jgi:dihydrofolate reductase
MPADMRRFREITMGKAVVMGRETYASIGKPLTGRCNIVLTRNTAFEAEGCTVTHSIKAAMEAAGEGEIMVIGGGQVYAQLLPLADRIYLTLIDAEFEGDSYFPRIDMAVWREVSREIFAADDENPYNYAFIVLDRREPAA